MRVFQNVNGVVLPDLTDGQYYIYVLENAPQGNIKIGRSQHIRQRLQSLSGSNSGGNQIVRCAVSDPTYLYSLESLLHLHYQAFRISGTEWFCGKDLCFDDVVAYVDQLFQSRSYALCNEVRRQYTMQYGPQLHIEKKEGAATAAPVGKEK